MHPYDPWQKYRTISDISADLVISAVQKEIRRNHEENAMFLAYEMLATSIDMEEYLWQRLCVISVEDIGFGDIMAPVVISSLNTMRKTIKGDGDRRLFAIHAVRYLCSRVKDRSSDEAYNWIMYLRESGKGIPDIPDYAVDKHTLEGQKLGRNTKDFYSEGSLVEPELKTRNTSYKEKIQKILDDIDKI